MFVLITCPGKFNLHNLNLTFFTLFIIIYLEMKENILNQKGGHYATKEEVFNA